MRGKIRDFLRIPPEILPAFRQDTLQKNRLSLLVIAAMIFGMEAYNIARVLFMSRSGLGTLNNRIYFGMYCALLLAAACFGGTGALLGRQFRACAYSTSASPLPSSGTSASTPTTSCATRMGK